MAAVLVGSLRKDSINRKVALALADLAPVTLKLNIVEIGDLPLYNEDLAVDRVFSQAANQDGNRVDLAHGGFPDV